MDGYAEIQPAHLPVEVSEVSETGLQILDKREAHLKELAEKFKDLKVSGVEDKLGFITIREARIALKNERCAITKDAKALRDNANKWVSKVRERELQLIGIIAPVENSLQVEEDRINEEKENIRKENERKEAQQLQDRITSLAAYNYAHDVIELKHMSDDQYAELLKTVEFDHKLEQQRIANEKAIEEQKLQAEQDRLRLEREEFDRQKEAFAKREAELKALHEKEVAQQRAEQERVAKEQSEREAAIQVQQNLREAELRAEREKLEQEKRAIELERAKAESAERARIEEQLRIKREAEEKAELERQAKLEAERQEAIKPDKEKLEKLAYHLIAMPLPTVTDAKAQDILNTVQESLLMLSNLIKEEVEKL